MIHLGSVMLTALGNTLTLSHIMLKYSQAYFKYLAVFTQQDFQSMFTHFKNHE